MTFKIYYLIDPRTDEIRYVGQTGISLNRRLKIHLSSKDKSHRTYWIQSLLTQGVKPLIQLIEICPTKPECNDAEKHHIRILKEAGARLVNMTEGGDGSHGFKHSDDTKKKLSAIRKLLTTPELKEYLRISATEQWERKTEAEKMDNILMQPNRRSIWQCDLEGNRIREFISLREVQRQLGYFRANISPCLKGIYKQAYGFTWKYSI